MICIISAIKKANLTTRPILYNWLSCVLTLSQMFPIMFKSSKICNLIHSGSSIWSHVNGVIRHCHSSRNLQGNTWKQTAQFKGLVFGSRIGFRVWVSYLGWVSGFGFWFVWYLGQSFLFWSGSGFCFGIKGRLYG